MPGTMTIAGPHPSRGALTWAALLLLLFVPLGTPTYGYAGRSPLRSTSQDEPDEKKVPTLKPGARVSRRMLAGQHSYHVRLTKNDLVYVTIRQKGLVLKAEVFGPDGDPVALHGGDTASLELAFPIYARAGGRYLIRLARAAEGGAGPKPSSGYTIGLESMPLLGVNGRSERGVAVNSSRHYGMSLNAGEFLYLEINAQDDLNVVLTDPLGKPLEDSFVVTRTAGGGAQFSLYFHAKTSGLYHVELRPHYDPAHRRLAYQIKAAEPSSLGNGETRELMPGNNVYGLNFMAGQVFRAKLFNYVAGESPYVYAQDPNDKLRKLAVTTSPDGLSVAFVAAVAGRYGLIVNNSNLGRSSGSRLGVEELRAASPQDKTDFAAQSCDPNPSPRNRGNIGDELKFFDTCFYALSRLVADSHPEVIRLSDGVYESVNLMALKWDRKSITPLYTRSLNAIYGALEVARTAPDREKAYTVLSIIAADIGIKAEHCRKSRRGLGDPVRLIVKTIRGGEPVTGYSVFCIPTLEEYVKTAPPIPFDRISDPEAEQVLPPGQYKVWGEQSEKQRKEIKNTVELGFGEATRKAPIRVP